MRHIQYACSTMAFLDVVFFFFFQAEDGIRDKLVTGVQTCALPICGFQRTLSPHFTVLFEGPAEQRLAAAAVDALEAAYWRIGTALLAYPPTVITVVLYTDEQFRDVTRSPAWAGGVFDGKIRVPMRGALNDPR